MLGNLKGGSKQERFQIIEKVAAYGDIQKLCDVFGVQRSGFYAYVKRKRRSSSSYAPGQRVAENLLKRDFSAEKPNQKYVTDITQFVWESAGYIFRHKERICLITRIVAYEMGERNDNQLVIRTFSKAFAKQKDVTGLVVHSDQGLQYTSHAYHDMLPKVSVLIISERLPKHKVKSINISVFTTENGQIGI